jgi:hypothetical protein
MIGVLICVGCGDERKALLNVKRDIQSICVTYDCFIHDRGRSPHDATELQAWEDPIPSNADLQDRARKALQSGNYVVIWDAAIHPNAEQRSRIVLIYGKDVPNKGGSVCYQDATVAVLTREEFERAAKSEVQADTNPPR